MRRKFHLKGRPCSRLKAQLLAPFLSRYRDKLPTYELPLEVRSLLSHVVNVPDGRLAFVRNFKSGCSTVTRALDLLYGGNPDTKKIHRGNTALRQGPGHRSDAMASFASDDCLTFTFVRHPESRLMSAFYDFVVEAKNVNSRKHVAPLRSFGMREGLAAEQKLDVFLDYVGECLERHRDRTDRHFALQVDNIALGMVDYGLIGRIENYERDMAEVLRISGHGADQLERIRELKSNATASAKIKPSMAQRMRIEAIYAEDFDRLGYDRRSSVIAE